MSIDTSVVRVVREAWFFVGSPMGDRSMRPKTTLRVLPKELDIALIPTGITCEVMLELKKQKLQTIIGVVEGFTAGRHFVKPKDKANVNPFCVHR